MKLMTRYRTGFVDSKKYRRYGASGLTLSNLVGRWAFLLDRETLRPQNRPITFYNIP